MYALHDNGFVKKPSKKPNILRRKPKVSHHSKQTETAVTPFYTSVKKDTSPVEVYISSGHSSQYLDEFIVPQDIGSNISDDTNIEMKMESSSSGLFEPFQLSENNETCEPQSSLNVESFLINGDLKETSKLANMENTTLNSEQETEDKTKWCLNFINDDSKDMSTSSYFDRSQIQISNVIPGDKTFESSEESAAVPLTAVSMSNGATEQLQDAEKLPQNVADLYHSRVTKFKKGYRNCMVPKCGNKTTTKPEKLYFSGPRDEELRKKWCSLLGRFKPTARSSPLYACEDHFDIEFDMENYMRYKLVGGIVHPQLKKGVLPHKFDCQNDTKKTAETKTMTNCYICDMPNCTKGFWTEAKLLKHKNGHGHKKKSTNPVTVVCPVSKTGDDGVDVKCGRTFAARDLLLKHLNEDHTLEDAAFRCSRCDRRFFWAIGMRTHEQGSCSRAYACTWPGCGRVFRQPCRLREHARVHTGDRPYPCHYPNCGWSFRSASKLMRHARRHTGERRHECGACGRAFLRREHLRDHAARHHAATRRLCPHTGCDLTFASMSGLCMHIRQKHRKEGEKPAKKPRTYKPKKDKNVIVVALADGGRTEVSRPPTPDTSIDSRIVSMTMSTAQTEDVVQLEINEEIGPSLEECVEFEGRAARTHCTWPLARAHTAPASPPSPLAHRYDIEDDSQTDQPEGSERNIYTVRSDLFLHGNVLINEDSEFTITREGRCSSTSADEASESRGATGATRGDPLSFIDSHPTIGLMQEELMYADAGVDETSFRVFLLNGEELS